MLLARIVSPALAEPAGCKPTWFGLTDAVTPRSVGETLADRDTEQQNPFKLVRSMLALVLEPETMVRDGELEDIP
jgi:hypothetical protein